MHLCQEERLTDMRVGDNEVNDFPPISSVHSLSKNVFLMRYPLFLHNPPPFEDMKEPKEDESLIIADSTLPKANSTFSPRASNSVPPF